MKLLLINSYSLAPRSSKYFAFFFSDLSADRFVRFLWKREFNFHFELKGGPIWHVVSPNFVQVAFSPNNSDRRLKFCMQPL